MDDSSETIKILLPSNFVIAAASQEVSSVQEDAPPIYTEVVSTNPNTPNTTQPQFPTDSKNSLLSHRAQNSAEDADSPQASNITAYNDTETTENLTSSTIHSTDQSTSEPRANLKTLKINPTTTKYRIYELHLSVFLLIIAAIGSSAVRYNEFTSLTSLSVFNIVYTILLIVGRKRVSHSYLIKLIILLFDVFLALSYLFFSGYLLVDTIIILVRNEEVFSITHYVIKFVT
ncbi:hypothetical protein HK099_000165, partial [Clydaea vesicula]